MVGPDTYDAHRPRVRQVLIRGELVTIIDATTTGTGTVTCPSPWCSGTFSCNCAPIEKLRDALHRIKNLDRELRSFIKLASLIPSKGHSGTIPPIQLLPPPITTAAPAPDDRRRAIWAFMTVRPLRVP